VTAAGSPTTVLITRLDKLLKLKDRDKSMGHLHRIDTLFTLILVIHNTHDGWVASPRGLSFSQFSPDGLNLLLSFFLSDEIHGNSTIEESQIKSIYGVGSTTAGSSRIALSRGRAGGDEARRPLDSSGRRRGECAGGVVRRGTPGSGGAGAPLPGIGAADRAE